MTLEQLHSIVAQVFAPLMWLTPEQQQLVIQLVDQKLRELRKL